MEQITFAGDAEVTTSALINHTWGTELLLDVRGLAEARRTTSCTTPRRATSTAGSLLAVADVVMKCRFNAATLRADVRAIELRGPDGCRRPAGRPAVDTCDLSGHDGRMSDATWEPSRPSGTGSGRRTSSPGRAGGVDRPRAAPHRADQQRRRADRALLPGRARLPADRADREPRLRRLLALLLRHRQRQPARVLRLPRARRRAVRRGARRPAPHGDLGRAGRVGGSWSTGSPRPASSTRCTAGSRSTSATPTAPGSS